MDEGSNLIVDIHTQEGSNLRADGGGLAYASGNERQRFPRYNIQIVCTPGQWIINDKFALEAAH